MSDAAPSPPERSPFEFDAYSPAQIALMVERIGVAKACMPLVPMSMLGIVAGGFIGLGALFSVIVSSDADLSFGVSRVLSGTVFSLGLILVVVAGAELFTGNNLLVMAWAERKITTRQLARNWAVVFAANAFGAAGLALIVWLANHGSMNGEGVALQYVKIATGKVNLPFTEAFFKGVLCNLLVCLAVWLSLAGHSVTDKILAIVFPITAFVAAGFEHCIANLYFIPMGILLAGSAPAAAGAESLNAMGLLSNLVPVTLGNIAGGSLMVALVYYVIYRMTHAR